MCVWSFIKHGRSKNITNPIFSHLNFVVLRCVPNRLYVVSYNKYFLPFLFEDLLKSINNSWQQDLDEQTFKKMKVISIVEKNYNIEDIKVSCLFTRYLPHSLKICTAFGHIVTHVNQIPKSHIPEKIKYFLGLCLSKNFYYYLLNFFITKILRHYT